MYYLPILTLLARGGGGGSGGGGSGGGGVAVLIGYMPMHFLGAKLKKHLSSVGASIVMWPIAIVYFIILAAALRGYGFFIGIAALIGSGAGLYGWFDKILKLNKKAKKDLAVAAATDTTWNESLLRERASQVFYSYQQDWSSGNAEAIQSYTSARYFYHVQLMLYALNLAGRKNVVGNPTISDIQLIAIEDAEGKAGDSFTVAVTASADDQLVQAADNSVLFKDTNSFTEFWQFERINEQWQLNAIQQATENGYMRSNELQQFAQSQNFCFSPDWGWLLLPTRGQLFSKSNFGKSDINNHVIGAYNNLLIQIYNYIPVKTNKERITNYLIAQVNVPKSYGNIVVRKKRKFAIFSGLKGLQRVTLEWQDFNNRYEVWASDLERVTSLELLHPAFMVTLESLPFEVNIEVVDNVVYLYSAKVPATSENYTILLNILKEAFKQMRL